MEWTHKIEIEKLALILGTQELKKDGAELDYLLSITSILSGPTQSTR